MTRHQAITQISLRKDSSMLCDFMMHLSFWGCQFFQVFHSVARYFGRHLSSISCAICVSFIDKISCLSWINNKTFHISVKSVHDFSTFQRVLICFYCILNTKSFTSICMMSAFFFFFFAIFLYSDGRLRSLPQLIFKGLCLSVLALKCITAQVWLKEKKTQT